MVRIIYILLLLLSINLCVAASDRYAKTSVLNEGTWVKIAVEENGIYKLPYADLRKMGFDNPEKVSVYGYGGWPLDEDFTKPYVDDLPAVAIWKGSDYLLFYGRGTTKWEYKDSHFIHTRNPYATKGYYFLTDRDETPKVMESLASDGTMSGVQIHAFDDYKLHEQELLSVNMSGRHLFGEKFTSSTPLTISDLSSIPGITNDTGYATMRFIARPANRQGIAKLFIDEMEVLTCSIKTTKENYTVALADERIGSWKVDNKEKIDVKVSYNNPSDENAHLDYIRLEMKRELKPYGAFTFFRSTQAKASGGRFVIQNANERTMVWDITDPANVRVMEATLKGSELSFSVAKSDVLREFVLVQPDHAGFDVPEKSGDVANQNLHGWDQLDMAIIALPFMRDQAQRLADAHIARNGLKVRVVDPHEIYNEFSSGTPDASAYRRFMKMFFDRAHAATGENPPRFLLLFGDGLYDNRGLCANIRNTYPASNIHERMLLTFQSDNSLNGYSYVTDDYFGFLQDGYSGYKDIAYWKMDIGVGRLPLRTEQDARYAVDKIIGYMDNKQPGAWKNALAFLADDGNRKDDRHTHMKQSNQLGDTIEKNHPEFLVNKIFYDAYKKDFSGNATYPDVKKRVEQLLKSGLMMINYTGHGSTTSLSDEKIVTMEDINNYSYTKLPLWVTATCDFTRFDSPNTSAGEQVFLNRTSGGIALLTTTRVVYSSQNHTLNTALMNHLFDRENGRRLTLGENMMRTKNSQTLRGDSNKLNFILIGDPALTLAYPDYDIQITAINGQPASEIADIQALQKVTVEGEIRDGAGNLATGFNGMVYPTVLDSQDSITTLDNHKDGEVFTFADYPNTIFVGNDKVTGGKFSFTFTVPKDISYSGKLGKMNLYACDETTMDEAQGSFKNYRVGGTSPNPEKDEEGPEIRSLYLNDSTFVSGDKVNPTPLFIANLWDRSGVNITGSSIGHDVMLIIDGSTAWSYNLNSYFENIPDKEGEGRVIFPVPELPEGPHTAEFIVWDIHNNSSRTSFEFEVSPGLKPQLIEVYASPNPARQEVEFRLSHNRPESRMTVEIRVFDMTGRHLWTGTQTGSSELMKDFVLRWDLTNHSGNRLLPGIYVYRAAIKTKHSKEATQGNKLIIMAQ